MNLEKISEKYADRISNVHLAQMFRQCFMSTFDTTVQRNSDGSYFVITGDIPAMWLRDSSAQVNHYVRFARECRQAYDLILGLLSRQIKCIQIDAYANAFNREANGAGHQQDRTQQSPHIWERKYEIDSLCYPIRLAYLFWKHANTTEHFNSDFHSVMNVILDLWITEQNHEASPYYFERFDCPKSDTLPCDGKGSPVRYTGMTWSGFRPSDDACKYGYHVPANMFACVVLNYIKEIAKEVFGDSLLAARAHKLAKDIQVGIEKHATVSHEQFGLMYAYETDGFGNYNLMDDANVPSLLALPYLGYCSRTDQLYENTRRFILSQANPYFYSGSAAKGVGSPHTPSHYIWPIALCIQGLTTDDAEEMDEMIQILSSTDAGTGFMHESFCVNDPCKYTRPWFSWANTLFAELLMKRIDERGEF